MAPEPIVIKHGNARPSLNTAALIDIKRRKEPSGEYPHLVHVGVLLLLLESYFGALGLEALLYWHHDQES